MPLGHPAHLKEYLQINMDIKLPVLAKVLLSSITSCCSEEPLGDPDLRAQEKGRNKAEGIAAVWQKMFFDMKGKNVNILTGGFSRVVLGVWKFPVHRQLNFKCLPTPPLDKDEICTSKCLAFTQEMVTVLE